MKRKIALLLLCAISLFTTSQTFQLVADINWNGDSSPHNFIEYNNFLYFIADADFNNRYLYRYNPATNVYEQAPYTNQNTIPYSPASLAVHNGKLLFRAYDVNGDNELWISDGTAGGTQVLKNINPTGPSYPGAFFSYGNIALFAADDGVHGQQLWKTDGTSAGTVLLKNIFGYNFLEFNGTVFFAGTDSIHGEELWKTDGTLAGTQLVKDISPSGNSHPDYFALYNGQLYFTANDTIDTLSGYANRELWTTDGTPSGTHLVKDIWPDPVKGSNPSSLTVYNGLLYFIAYDGTSYGLWKTDGTTVGTELLKDFGNNWGNNDNNLIEYKGKLYFSVHEDTASEPGQLWQSDGTATNTFRVKSFGQNMPILYTTFNNKLYLTIDQGDMFNSDIRLVQCDGTEAGTNVIAPAISPNSNPLGTFYQEFYEMDGALYFAAGFDNVGIELWRLTQTGTGITQHSIQPISVFPNPNQGRFTLKLPQDAGNVEFTLYNALGQVVYKTIINSNAKELLISDDQLEPSVYTFTAKDASQSWTGKVVVQH